MLALGKLHAPTLGTTIYIGTMFAQRHIPPHPKALPESPEGTSSPTRSVRTTRLLRADEAGSAFSQGYSGSPTAGAEEPPCRMMFTTPTASVMVMALSPFTSAASKLKFSDSLPRILFTIATASVMVT